MELSTRLPALALVLADDSDLLALVVGILRILELRIEVVADEAGLLGRLAEDVPTADGIPALIVAFQPGSAEETRRFACAVRRVGGRIPIILMGGTVNRILDPHSWRKDGILVEIGEPFSVDDFIWVVRKTLE